MHHCLLIYSMRHIILILIFLKKFKQSKLILCKIFSVFSGLSHLYGNPGWVGHCWTLEATPPKTQKNILPLFKTMFHWDKCLQHETITTGFFQSRVDKCILLIYLDGCLMFSPDKAVLNSVIDHLGSMFKTTSEDDFGF
jgi:hypothetical protein